MLAVRIEVPEGAAAIGEFVGFHDRVYAGRGAFWPAFAAIEVPFVAGAGPIGDGRRCRPFVARDPRGAIVARALAVIDDRYHRHWNEPLGHVVKFEALPGTRDAVRALMDAACEWLARAGAVGARCGMGPLDMPFVIDAYDVLPPSILRVNPPYYHALLKDAGFETERGFVDYRVAVEPALVARWESAAAAVERAGYRLVRVRDVAAERRAGLIASLFNETFASHWGVSPITEEEQRTYLGLFDTSGALDASLIAYGGDEAVGFVTVGPESGDLAALAPGRVLAPAERLNWLGVGVRAPARGRGLAVGLCGRAFLELVGHGATHLSYTLVLDDNWPSRRTAERLGAEVCASYVAYRRSFQR